MSGWVTMWAYATGGFPWPRAIASSAYVQPGW